MSELSALEAGELKSAIGRFNESRPNRPVFAWNKYVINWSSFVAKTKEGYGDSVYDYTNDISIRGVIDSFLEDISPELRTKLERDLIIVDASFLEETRPDNENFLRGKMANGHAWWFRVPKKLVGELKEDIEGSQRETAEYSPRTRSE